MSGGGGEEESKSYKKAKLAVPHVALTSSTKRTAESDLMRSECNEGKQSGQSMNVAVRKDDKVELVKNKESKVFMGGAVSNGSVTKVKQLYIICNVKYWEGRKAVSLN